MKGVAIYLSDIHRTGSALQQALTIPVVQLAWSVEHSSSVRLILTSSNKYIHAFAPDLCTPLNDVRGAVEASYKDGL